jgi:hypothetical protein
MAQDYTNKLLSIGADSVTQAAAILGAVAALLQDAGLLAQAGGNFEDPIFESPPPSNFGGPPPTPLNHLDAYHANVLLQQAAPAISAFLDTNVAGDTGLPTYRALLEMMVAKPY